MIKNTLSLHSDSDSLSFTFVQQGLHNACPDLDHETLIAMTNDIVQYDEVGSTGETSEFYGTALEPEYVSYIIDGVRVVLPINLKIVSIAT